MVTHFGDWTWIAGWTILQDFRPGRIRDLALTSTLTEMTTVRSQKSTSVAVVVVP